MSGSTHHHGTSSLVASGCQCFHCYKAQARLPHGTETGFKNWGCRCGPCTDAHNSAETVRRPPSGGRARNPREFAEPPDWMQEGACRTMRPPSIDPRVFASWFHPGGDDRGTSDVGYARGKVLCAVCPVRDDCLAWAIEHKERLGLWGGLTPIERERLRRNRARRAS